MFPAEPSTQPIVITDALGRVLAIDASARRMLDAADVAGRPIDDVLPGVQEIVEDAVRTRGQGSAGTIALGGAKPKRVTATALAFGDVVALSFSRPSAVEAMDLLQAASRPFDVHREVDDALRSALGVLCEHMGWAVGEAWLKADGSLRLVAWAEREGGRFRALCEAGERLSFAPGVGLPGRAERSGEPVWIEDVQVDPGFVRREQAREAGVRSAVAIPLAAEGEVVAVLAFYLEEVTPVDEREVDLVATIAQELGAQVRRLAAESKLRKAKSLHVDLYETAPVAYFTVSAAGRLLRVNERACALTGHAATDLIGRHVLDLYAPTSSGVEKARRVFDEFVKGREVQGEELEMRDAGGRSVWVSLWVTPVRDADGNILESRSAAIDVTREHTMRSRLEESEERFRLMVQEVEDYAIYFLDPEGRVSSWNRGAMRLKGWTEEEITGRHISSFYPDDERRRVEGLLARAAEEGRVSDRGWHMRKDGSRFMAHVVITALRDGSGALRGYSKITRDLTEHVRHEEMMAKAARALERKARELERSNHDLEQFAYIASHDLQEPLRMVANYCELIQERYADRLDERGRRHLGFAVDGAQRMQQMIQDLLTYSRIGTRGKEFTKTEPTAVARSALAELQAAVQEAGAQIEIDDMPEVVADPAQLKQLFMNLLSNAIKFRHETGTPEIRVGASRGDDCWVFSVRDNGIGIDAQHADRLFVPFRRLHSRKDYAGTGIGLSICRRIVERRGGRIWFESELGEGTTFFFTVPDEVPEVEVRPDG